MASTDEDVQGVNIKIDLRTMDVAIFAGLTAPDAEARQFVNTNPEPDLLKEVCAKLNIAIFGVPKQRKIKLRIRDHKVIERDPSFPVSPVDRAVTSVVNAADPHRAAMGLFRSVLSALPEEAVPPKPKRAARKKQPATGARTPKGGGAKPDK